MCEPSNGMSNFRLKLNSTSLLLVMALSACSDSKDPIATPAAPNQVDTPDLIDMPNQVDAYPRVRFTPCAFDISNASKDIRCGVLDTFESYESTGVDARIIEVAFGIVPAIEKPVAPDPVVVFFGGPGISALTTFGLLAELDELSEVEFGANNRDVILVDQRGVGFSKPHLQCDGLFVSGDFSNDLDVAEARLCVDEFEQQGVELSEYRSGVIAQDFKALREALEIEQWNVYGESYGPIPGILYAALDPAGVRSVIFDSSTDNQVDIALADAAARLDYITVLAAQCAQETECATRLPDFRNVFIDTFRSLMEDPWVVSLPDTTEQEEFDGIFMYETMLDVGPLAAPAILELFANRDLELLLELSSEGEVDDTDPVIIEKLEERLEADLMHATVQCAAIDAQNFETAVISTVDQWPDDFLNLARASVAYPLVCTSGVFSIEQDLIQRMPLKLDVPALILGGALDGFVSIKEVRKLSESFVSPNVAIVPKGGHGVYFPAVDACVEDIVTTFLENPVNAPEMACLGEDVKPFLFGEDLLSEF